MKKIGDYTVKGQLTTSVSDSEKIQLFDGSFRTGYRVTSLVIRLQDRDDTAIEVASVKLSTIPIANNRTWNWAVNTEIGWASCGHDANGLSTQSPEATIDPDNMIVEDLYIGGYSSTDAEVVNYMITMEKYDISDWQGALAMVRNKAQNV